MKKITFLKPFGFFEIFNCVMCAESEYISNLPKIEGFEVKKIYRLNRNLLAAYIDSSGNRLVFKLNESSATGKKGILLKNKSISITG
ncbi:MAG: hypothetical protein CM1200mP30_19540 [Pseudomonadota bacterium]|nr:MAG: hypothetical protein CM1200mP30_19540 [Pseudomonadota bacterium]